MKKVSILLAASVAAASSSVFLSYSNARCSFPSQNEGSSSSISMESRSGRGVDDDKFAPRFDGLRFIETLVTAHR
ncbi:hypothetical protein HPP92_014513 [Vanilla planifolia]|uniref:Uncharacterized protein n=1 Tax=Vanilla planifolia TaxID=51239 RepID=A0A835QU09_VANPL|nr:hypothetical protein HPP92_014946 [Vanilla planifolia]KAG0474827.1 hypothetical protein HPP92_014513 [Vanilla planifolia]